MKLLQQCDANPYTADDSLTIAKPEAEIIIDNSNIRVVACKNRKLNIEKDYYQYIKSCLRKKEDKQYVRKNYYETKFLLKAVAKREDTILKVLNEIIILQKNFFLKGVEYLKPMTLEEIANILGLNVSTISRISNKFILLNGKSYRIASFFSSGSNNLSNLAIKQIINKLIQQENRKFPLSDQDIVNKLCEQQIYIARRTVSKYRKQLLIPNKNLRLQNYDYDFT